MFLPTLFILLFAGVDAVGFFYESTKGNLLSECAFKMGDQTYDLCPLMRSKGRVKVRGRTQVLGRVGLQSEGIYWFDFEGMRHERRRLDRAAQETRGADWAQHEVSTWTINRFVGWEVQYASPLVDDDSERSTPHPVLVGNFQGTAGDHAKIQFICNHDAKMTEPSFVEERHGVLLFSWTTKYGCPSPRFPPIYAFEIEVDTDHDPNGSEIPHENPGSDELPNSSPKTSRHLITIILWIAGISLIVLSILTAFPNTRFVLFSHLRALPSTMRLSQLHINVKRNLPLLSHFSWPRSFPGQFYTSEDRLIRWAHEDIALGLMDGGMERHRSGDGGEVRGVVNEWRTEEDKWEGDDEGEYVPLKTFKAGDLVRDYGSRGKRAKEEDEVVERRRKWWFG